MSDKRLPSSLSAAVRREQFEALHAEHHARVLGYVLRRVPADDAADIVAETFLVAWRRLEDAQSQDTRLWLYGVARRVLANHRRGERRRSRLADTLREELSRRDPSSPPTEENAALAAAFQRLSDAEREVLALEAWEQLDPGEVAAVLGCSRNAARIRLHRARRRLRVELARTQGQGPRARAPERAATTGIPASREPPAEPDAGKRARRPAPTHELTVTRGDLA